MLHAGAPHIGSAGRMMAQPSQLLAWWEAHPGFLPRAKAKKP